LKALKDESATRGEHGDCDGGQQECTHDPISRRIAWLMDAKPYECQCTDI
jgi:hypothetical protein